MGGAGSGKAGIAKLSEGLRLCVEGDGEPWEREGREMPFDCDPGRLPGKGRFGWT